MGQRRVAVADGVSASMSDLVDLAGSFFQRMIEFIALCLDSQSVDLRLDGHLRRVEAFVVACVHNATFRTVCSSSWVRAEHDGKRVSAQGAESIFFWHDHTSQFEGTKLF